jgi:hypothetical protein
MQLFSQLQSFIYFDNTSLSQFSNSFGRVFENDLRMVYEDYARVVDNNSSVYSNINPTIQLINPISSLKDDDPTKETANLLDSNKLDINKVEKHHIFLNYRKTTVNLTSFIVGVNKNVAI